MKPGENIYWNHHFTVEIRTPRTWVRWGYAKGDEKPKPVHTGPKSEKLDFGKFAIYCEFKLPDGFESDGVKHRAEVVDEVVKWGWRICHENAPSGDCYLADSKEECLRQAKEYFRLNGLIPEGIRVVDVEGQISEEPLDAEWQEFANEAFAAVDSWQTGKGWPKNWRGKEA